LGSVQGSDRFSDSSGGQTGISQKMTEMGLEGTDRLQVLRRSRVTVGHARKLWDSPRDAVGYVDGFR
jgi:hypothetical protein